jgi:hypothetical protein
MNVTIHVDDKATIKALRECAELVSVECGRAIGTSMANVEMQAKRDHKYKSKSGQLNKSIISSVRKDGLQGTVRLEKSIAKYGEWQHDGTDPYVIRAKNKAALHFVKGGVGWLVPKKPYIGKGKKNPFWIGVQEKGGNISWKGHVNHPGIKEDKFLYRAFTSLLPEAQKAIERALEAAIRKSGAAT